MEAFIRRGLGPTELIAYDASVSGSDVSMWTKHDSDVSYDSVKAAAKFKNNGASTSRYSYLTPMLDLTEYTTAAFEIYSYQTSERYNSSCGVSPQIPSQYDYDPHYAASAPYALNETEWQTITVDISGLSGNYYILVGSASPGEGAFCRKITLS